MKYGMLTILHHVLDKKGNKKVTCRCDCGRVKEFWLSNVVRGKSKCCGCNQPARKVQCNPLRGKRPLTEQQKKANQERYKAGVLQPWMKG